MLEAAQVQNLDHARVLRARGAALPPDGTPGVAILDSWARCADQGLVPGTALVIPVVEAADLARRRERAEFVRRLAQAELETLSRQIAGSNFLLAFADDEGVILDLYADNRFSMSGADAGIVAGSCWRESVAGTNGLGTALATNQPVAVTGLEHYFLQLGTVSCTAAPVRDASGNVVGVLDASSYYESRQRHTQALVQMAATHIENGMLAFQMQGRLVLAVHPRAEYLSTLSAGLLAFDGAGLLEAVNGPARSLLSGLSTGRGTSFEELFGEPMDLVLARLQLRAEVQLRDALGSTLVARMVGRPVHASAARTKGRSNVAARTTTHAEGSHHGQYAPPMRHEQFVADDPDVAEACRMVESAVRMGVPILLHGETGTGKELLARHAHAVSGRTGAFVPVNCAAIPGELFEAELFGYAPGAFTGARRDGNEGLIRSAHGGTLLLDEVRELPPKMQAALLRFLDNHQVRPVGERHAIDVDVQVMAASHANLEEEVQAKSFREDLLYRLNTVRVSLPPLRTRRDFARAARAALHSIDARLTLSDLAVQRMAAYTWPGNFRELRSVLTRLVLRRNATGVEISAEEVDALLPAAAPAGSLLQQAAGERVRQEFARSGGSVSRTARNLGISRTTVYRYIRG
jgi:transcriptional regulator of acetoin/glycerol metabolism